MTITLLAFVSLFVLVVTGRPILPGLNIRTPSALQTAVQAAFQVHPGKDELKLDATRAQFPTTGRQNEYLPQLDEKSIGAIVSLVLASGKKPPVEETILRGLVSDEDVGVHDMVAHNQPTEPRIGDAAEELVFSESASSQSVDKQQVVASSLEFGKGSSIPLLVLLLSCIAAFLALACIALTLHVTKHLGSQVLASKKAWKLLPHFGKCPKSSRFQDTTTSSLEKPLYDGNSPLLRAGIQQQHLHDAEEGTMEKCGLPAQDKLIYFDGIPDIDSNWDDVAEKFQDALDMTPLPPVHDLPPDVTVHLGQSCFMDPSLPSSQDNPPDQRSPFETDRMHSAMRESCPAPVSRPAWSVRAVDCPPLGLSTSEATIDSTSQSLIHPRRRAYRSVVPEFDIALAMQLRPGLGIGADSAWMIRFLMAIFGWFAVALTSNR